MPQREIFSKQANEGTGQKSQFRAVTGSVPEVEDEVKARTVFRCSSRVRGVGGRKVHCREEPSKRPARDRLIGSFKPLPLR